VRRAIPVLVVLGVLALSSGAAAADCPKTSVSDLEDEVMCPVCGTSLGLAREAPQAKRERAFIARLVASCRSKDQVKAALASEFGDAVLALPSSRGFDLSAYLIPLMAVLLAAAAIGGSLVRWRRAGGGGNAPPAATMPAPPDPHDAARLDAELARYDR
jgi:cytochrome c-type biogenesis protein CcmH